MVHRQQSSSTTEYTGAQTFKRRRAMRKTIPCSPSQHPNKARRKRIHRSLVSPDLLMNFQIIVLITLAAMLYTSVLSPSPLDGLLVLNDQRFDSSSSTTSFFAQTPQLESSKLQRTLEIKVDTDAFSDGTLPPTEDVVTAEDVSVNVSFEDILLTVVFLLATWLAANIFRLIGLPSLAGEILTGVILGPPVLDVCPYPEAMVLIGSFGLIGLILNSGIDLDIAQLRETGSRAVLIAVSGTTVALCSGIGMSYWYANSSTILEFDMTVPIAFAVGASFAPSSWGVASQILSNGQVLNTPVGQTIMASSVVDDILGLVLLSLLQVFVMDDPTLFDYIKPFLASFGYLAVLGYVGITYIPNLLQHRILPYFSPDKQDVVAIGLMFLLMTAYMPLMNYTGASYLTGVFLSGVSFSQLHHVHATFAKSTHELMVWLMRIFFAATIGFQVPATYFKESEVLTKGMIFMVPILSKLLLGFWIPRINRQVPEDFPYNPYWRDFWITSLSMVCRGEFNFVVASVALRVGLLVPTQYAAIVFAVLTSCILGPLILSQVIKYYNNLSIKYIEASHPVERIGNTCDGYRPLYLAIQARTPVRWNWENKIEDVLDKAGLSIIDHRNWHTMGYKEAINVTEIFCQDRLVRVKIQGCFNVDNKAGSSSQVVGCDKHGNEIRSPLDDDMISAVLDGEESTDAELDPKNDERKVKDNASTGSDTADMSVESRREQIKEMIIQSLGDGISDDEFAIQVSEWETFSFSNNNDVEQGTVNDNGTVSDNHSYFFRQPSFNYGTVDSRAGDDEAFVEDEDDGGQDQVPSRPASVVEASVPLNDATYNKKPSETVTSPTSTLTPARTMTSSPSKRKRFTHSRSVSFASYSEVSVPEEASHLSTTDLWDTDEGCHSCAREGYYQTPAASDGTIAVSIEEGCSATRSRAHTISGGEAMRQAEEAAALPDDNNDASVASPLRSNSRRRKSAMHKRSQTFDASQLESFYLETLTIKERLHGYIR